jgi:hypothetical protein
MILRVKGKNARLKLSPMKFLFIWRSVYLPICLSVCPFVYLSLSIHLSVRLSVCSSVHPSIRLSICPSIHRSVCLSVRQGYLFRNSCLSIHLSMHPLSLGNCEIHMQQNILFIYIMKQDEILFKLKVKD